jgi:hypothetical protein
MARASAGRYFRRLSLPSEEKLEVGSDPRELATDALDFRISMLTSTRLPPNAISPAGFK